MTWLFHTQKKPYFWSVRTISVRNIAEVDIARHTREVVSRFLKSFSNERNNKMLILPVIGKSSVVPVENYSKICEVVTLTHLREFFRQLYSLLLHLKVQIVVCVITNRLSKAGQFAIETATKRRPIE